MGQFRNVRRPERSAFPKIRVNSSLVPCFRSCSRKHNKFEPGLDGADRSDLANGFNWDLDSEDFSAAAKHIIQRSNHHRQRNALFRKHKIEKLLWPSKNTRKPQNLPEKDLRMSGFQSMIFWKSFDLTKKPRKTWPAFRKFCMELIKKVWVVTFFVSANHRSKEKID